MSKALSSTVSAPSGLFGVFTNRRISTKIGIGFGCILVITALISAISYVEFGKIDRDFSDYTRKVTNALGCFISDPLAVVANVLRKSLRTVPFALK